MIDVEDLIALVRNYNPRSNADLIRRAAGVAARALGGAYHVGHRIGAR